MGLNDWSTINTFNRILISLSKPHRTILYLDGINSLTTLKTTKQALADTFASFLKSRDVRIVVNRGYSGWSFLYENCMRLLEVKRSGKEIHILYFGDFDPSGDDHLDKAFQRMAVTEEQIEEFNLPPMPKSKETIDKVNHDTRKNGFIKKYGRLYIVER